MPEFKTKEDYEKWKAQRMKETKRESQPAPEGDHHPHEETTPPSSQQRAKIKTGGSFAGPGCLLQGLGLLLFAGSFLMFPLGPLFGLPLLIVLFIWGSSKSRKLHCSQCGNPIDNKKVRLCPACKATFN